MSENPIRVEIDGRPATENSLRPAALVNYGHFTSMQVRRGCVRGLDLHLGRLVSATEELFGVDVDRELIRARIRHALRDTADASVRVNVFRPADEEPVTVMVVIRAPAEPAGTPQRLMSVPYQRAAAHIKHVGTFGLIYYGRLAARHGFDDALLTTVDGIISEAAISNIGFYDGTSVVWPDAPCLLGITMQLLQARLPGMGIPTRQALVRLADLTSYQAAFVTNSIGIAPVSRINDVRFDVDVDLVQTLIGTYDAVARDRI